MNPLHLSSPSGLSFPSLNLRISVFLLLSCSKNLPGALAGVGNHNVSHFIVGETQRFSQQPVFLRSFFACVSALI